jgi:hypothetical protein
VVAIVVVSNFTVMLLLAVNPEPKSDTEVLTAPEAGESVMVADGFTVKVAEPVMVPSAADTVWLPAVAPGGTANVVALIKPDAVAVTVAGFVVTVVLSNFIVIVLLAPKPEPDTVTVVPTAPEVGDIVTVPPTVNVAVAVLVPPVAVTVLLPSAALAGTVKEALNVPDVVVDTVVGIVVTVLLPSFKVMEVLAGKLEPVTVTDEPTGPLVGERIIVGVEEITLNVASGVSAVP